MTTSALNITFDDDTFSVELSDGRSIRVPFVWFQRLLHATPEERSFYELSHRGIHWGAINEDISVDGLLTARLGVTLPFTVAAQPWSDKARRLAVLRES